MPLLLKNDRGSGEDRWLALAITRCLRAGFRPFVSKTTVMPNLHLPEGTGMGVDFWTFLPSPDPWQTLVSTWLGHTSVCFTCGGLAWTFVRGLLQGDTWQALLQLGEGTGAWPWLCPSDQSLLSCRVSSSRFPQT